MYPRLYLTVMTYVLPGLDGQMKEWTMIKFGMSAADSKREIEALVSTVFRWCAACA